MPSSYSWTERIQTTNTADGAAVTDVTAVHTITWQDVDIGVLNAGYAARAVAESNAVGAITALDPCSKTHIDYTASANASAWKTAAIAVATAAAQLQAQAQAAVLTDAVQTHDADIASASFAKALGPLFSPPVGRQVVTAPGQYAKLPSGAVLSMGPNGEVYQDGARVTNSDGTASAVTKLVVAGLSIYGVGKTSGLWFKRTSTTWVQVTDFDAATLN